MTQSKEILNRASQSVFGEAAHDLKKLQQRFREVLIQLKEEAERLRTEYPLRDLVSAKEAELKRLRGAISKVPEDHPERPTIEAMIQSHLEEYRELLQIQSHSEKRFQAHLAQIRNADWFEVELDLIVPRHQEQVERIPEF